VDCLPYPPGLAHERHSPFYSPVNYSDISPCSSLHLSFILYNLSFFTVDILSLKPIIHPVCIGTHNASAGGQASLREASPFHYSPFKIQNSSLSPVKVSEGGKKNRQYWAALKKNIDRFWAVLSKLRW
jgi:hypothetical protein